MIATTLIGELLKFIIALVVGLSTGGIFFLLSYLFTKKKEQNKIEPPSFEESMGEQKKLDKI